MISKNSIRIKITLSKALYLACRKHHLRVSKIVSMKTKELDKFLEFAMLTLILFKLSDGMMRYVWGVLVAMYAVEALIALFRLFKKRKE